MSESIEASSAFHYTCALKSPQHHFVTITLMVDAGLIIDKMLVKNLVHQSMQTMFGICNSAYHIDILKYDVKSSTECKMILMVPVEALDMLLQSLPSTTFYQERRCVFRVERISPLLSQL